MADAATGWADPARQGAVAFRAILDAMARPGRVASVGGLVPPPGLSLAAAAVLLALTDADTPLWLAPPLATGPAADWLRFHTNAPLTGSPMFAVGGWDDLMPLDRWPAGDPAYPDRGATLVVEVADLATGPALTLTGPGIEHHATLAPTLPQGACALLRANAARFPLGLDFIFTAGAQLAALPRSTSIGA